MPSAQPVMQEAIKEHLLKPARVGMEDQHVDPAHSNEAPADGTATDTASVLLDEERPGDASEPRSPSASSSGRRDPIDVGYLQDLLAVELGPPKFQVRLFPPTFLHQSALLEPCAR